MIQNFHIFTITLVINYSVIYIESNDQKNDYQLRYRIFAKDYGFLSFAKNIGKNVGKSLSKNLSVKYSQKRFDRAKQSATDPRKTNSKRVKTNSKNPKNS